MKHKAVVSGTESSSQSKKRRISSDIVSSTLHTLTEEFQRQFDDASRRAKTASHLPQLDTLLATPFADGAMLFWNITSGGIARAKTRLSSMSPTELQLRIYIDRGPGCADMVCKPVNRWTHHYRFVAPSGTTRVSATVGLLSDQDFIHITASVPVRLMNLAPGTGAVHFSSLEATKRGLTLKDEGPWAGELPPQNWEMAGLSRSTLPIFPEPGQIDKSRIERRPAKGR